MRAGYSILPVVDGLGALGVENASAGADIPQSNLTGGRWANILGIGIDYPACWGPDWISPSCWAARGAEYAFRRMDASAAAEEGAAQAVIATASKETAQAEIAQAQAQTTVAQQGTQTAIWQFLPLGIGIAVVGAGIIGYLIYRSNRQRDELLQTVISQSQMGTAAQ